MTIPIKTNFEINESHLLKEQATEKAKQLMRFAQSKREDKMVRNASVNTDQLIMLFAEMLKALNINATGNVQDVMHNLMAKSGDGIKESSVKKTSRFDGIKIVSKQIKDSHYEVDISKDIVDHADGKLFMVSCYMKDAYLGRYVIKRNYFYTMDRETSADNTYNEILLKMGSLKDRYYNSIIKVSAITTQAKTILDGVISELELSDDTLGTTVKRNQIQ